MMLTTKTLLFSTVLFAATLISSCGNNDKKQQADTKNDSVKPIAKKEEKKKKEDSKYQRPPIINIVDTLAPKRLIAYCKDSALNFERIPLKLGDIYSVRLQEYIKKNNLKVTGAPMAWYTKDKAPYFFEAGIPVNKAGAKAVKTVQIRETSAGKVVVAHFFGPFELLPQGYNAIREFIKDNKKSISGPPYEIYITDAIDKNGKPVDPYKIQTDIVFPIK